MPRRPAQMGVVTGKWRFPCLIPDLQPPAYPLAFQNSASKPVNQACMSRPGLQGPVHATQARLYYNSLEACFFSQDTYIPVGRDEPMAPPKRLDGHRPHHRIPRINVTGVGAKAQALHRTLESTSRPTSARAAMARLRRIGIPKLISSSCFAIRETLQTLMPSWNACSFRVGNRTESGQTGYPGHRGAGGRSMAEKLNRRRRYVGTATVARILWGSWI